MTLRTHANAVFECRLGQAMDYPILRSALAFNASLSAALRDQYRSSGVDVMQALVPYVSFESWISRGLILEVVMQERMLAVNVQSVLNHLVQGYAETHGSIEEALASNFNSLRLRLTAPFSPIQAQLLQRHLQMEDARRVHVTEEAAE